MSLGDRAGRHGVAEGFFTDARAAVRAGRRWASGGPGTDPGQSGLVAGLIGRPNWAADGWGLAAPKRSAGWCRLGCSDHESVA
jgi:hypothetical protein